jgi:hypothetical protein
MATPDKVKSSGVLLFQKSLSPTYATITSNAYNLSERLMRMQDFQEMEQTAEISSTLDIVADETCSVDDKGRALHVYSDNPKIKETIEELFYDTLNMEFSLRSLVRNTIKYGDSFQYIDVHPNYGVVGSFPVPVNEIEREENYDRNDPFATRFRWVSMGNRTLENWEIAHFRLLGQDQFIPYGCSWIESARKIWRQLMLLEDAMLVYRVSRAPERRVFYVDVANLPPDEVEAYMEQQKQKLRTSSVVDKETGRVDLRYSPLPVHKDTPIPLLDGRVITIEQLSSELSNDPDNMKWVYSVQDKTNKLVPGKVIWCGKNYAAKELIKVWLDNDSYVMTAPEHPFVMRDGTSKRADELKRGQSLMPLYRKLSSKVEKDYIDGYEKTYDPSTDKYKYTHRIVAESVVEKQHAKQCVVHHVNFRKRNNAPENLQWMTYSEHKHYHTEQIQFTLNSPEQLVIKAAKFAEMNKTDEHKNVIIAANKLYRKAEKMGEMYNGTSLHASHNEIRRQAQLKSWGDPVSRAKRQSVMKCVIPDEFIEICKQELIANPRLSRDGLHEKMMSNEEVVTMLNSVQTYHRLRKMSCGMWVNKLVQMGYEGFGDFKKKVLQEVGIKPLKNHKVTKIERVHVDAEDVYCMTVVGLNGEDDRHNFAVCGLKCVDGVFEVQNDGIFVKNSIDEDYVIATRGGESGTKIDTLAGLQNQGNVEDVAYLQKKLFAALKIPAAYLGYGDALGSKASLSQLDVRFSRSIASIQRVIIAELNKIAVIHLFAHGFKGDDLQNFVLRLSNPSTVAQQQKLELWRAKFEIAGSAPEGMASRNFIRREILMLNNEQIETLDEERYDEKLVDAAIENAGAGEQVVADKSGDGESDEDLFGGGGEKEGSPEKEEKPEASAEKEEKPENAGTLHDDDAQLLTSSDVDEDDDFVNKAMLELDGSLPIKPNGHLQKALYNNQRQRHHGASTTYMPEVDRMAKTGDLLDDPYDKDFFRELATESKSTQKRVKITSVMRKTLSDMAQSKRFREANFDGGTVEKRVLTEGIDVQDEIDGLNQSIELDIDVEIV